MPQPFIPNAASVSLAEGTPTHVVYKAQFDPAAVSVALSAATPTKDIGREKTIAATSVAMSLATPVRVRYQPTFTPAATSITITISEGDWRVWTPVFNVLSYQGQTPCAIPGNMIPGRAIPGVESCASGLLFTFGTVPGSERQGLVGRRMTLSSTEIATTTTSPTFWVVNEAGWVLDYSEDVVSPPPADNWTHEAAA